MPSLLLSKRDLEFLLYDWLRVDELTKRDRFAEHSRETFDAVLELCEQLATRYFANHNKKSDAHEPTFDGATVTVIPEVKEALDAVAQADLVAMTADQRLRRCAVADHRGAGRASPGSPRPTSAPPAT